jgi:GNAT superfamily N-acetyltransferase
MDIETRHTFRNQTTVRIRAIKPSDEEAMRRLFYRFSDQTVYRRFFYPIRTMPHDKMQEYVNVDYGETMSVVALVRETDQEIIISEARYAKDEENAYGDVAFVVDENYQGLGIATYLYEMLIRLAKERGLKGFTAKVLQTNKGMMKVFENGHLPINARLRNGIYSLTIPFDRQRPAAKNNHLKF